MRILFHINDFGRGGTETALLAWLNALDRRVFEVGLSVTYPTPDLTIWCAKAIPPDVALQVLAPQPWMHVLHQRERVRKLHGGEKLLHKASTHALIRPIVARRFLRLARGYDVVCDFDFSLRRIAGGGASRGSASAITASPRASATRARRTWRAAFVSMSVTRRSRCSRPPCGAKPSRSSRIPASSSPHCRT
ncbi:glycosyl transferase, group 1 family domain protein [Burkholderia thailandensis]|uniref:Glycosyl transferase, group 1 family domain protein n=1 Tax=Burkholderia thailandensis TaxID=57975 RepID=A0AAW9D020_BURTH|nr:glycosyl transferase, group 1 family domain protein [Burkholderia thailandensis]